MLEAKNAHRPSHQIKAEARAIEALSASAGWTVLREYLVRDRETIIRALTAASNTPEPELHFNRAALRSINTILEYPSFVLTHLNNEMAMAVESEKLAKPVKDTSDADDS